MLTECHPDRFEFARVEGRAVVASFDGGRITSEAGALLLGATDLETLAIGPTRLASLDVQSQSVRELPGFDRGKHISPHWSPDGNTLVIGTSSTHAIAPAVFASLPYDPNADFQPVTLIGSATVMLVTHPSVPANSVAELIALAKAKPGSLNFASLGAATTDDACSARSGGRRPRTTRRQRLTARR